MNSTKAMGIQYDQMTDDQFYALFRDSSYKDLNDAARQEILQEAANRSAKMDGEDHAATVVLTDLHDPRIAGLQSGETIYLNSAYYGEKAAAKASPMEALETVLHEERHHYQEMAVQGLAPASPEQLKAFQANMGTEVQLSDGRKGYTYATGAPTSGQLSDGIYRAQPIESDAYRTSEERTKAIANRQTELMNNEKNPIVWLLNSGDKNAMSKYVQNVDKAGYDQQIQNAGRIFGVNNLEAEVKTAFTNIFYNESRRVNPVVSFMVEMEQAASYTQNNTQTQGQSQGQGQTYGQAQTRGQAGNGRAPNAQNSLTQHGLSTPGNSGLTAAETGGRWAQWAAQHVSAQSSVIKR